jgi:protein tyrosine/serine phosphatase
LLRRLTRFVPGLAVALSLVLVPMGYSRVREKHLGNFRVVEDGVLYRSAQLTPAGLERVVHDYGIKTVVSFRDTDPGKSGPPPDEWEEAFCAKLGITYVRMPLKHWATENGRAQAQDNVDRFLAVMADRKNHPVLVHCFKGIHRTGTYCAIYRMEYQGWQNKEAMDELHALGYENLMKEPDVRTYLEEYKPSHTSK